MEQCASKSPIFLSLALLLFARDQTCPGYLGIVCFDKLYLKEEERKDSSLSDTSLAQ